MKNQNNINNIYFNIECGKYSHWGYISKGQENNVRDMAETMRYSQSKPVLVTFVYNTHKGRVLQAKNGVTFIAPNFSEAQRFKELLKAKIKLVRVV